jgi:hypothetical protein
VTDAELAQAERVLAHHLPVGSAAPPVLLITEAGMAVKQWPDGHWRRPAGALGERGHSVLALVPVPCAPSLPAADLRGLAAVLAAAGRRGVASAAASPRAEAQGTCRFTARRARRDHLCA